MNGQVKYSIVQQPNQKGTKFTVDEETGEVSTNKVSFSDYEETSCDKVFKEEENCYGLISVNIKRCMV